MNFEEMDLEEIREEVRENLPINRDALDDECNKQAQIYMEVSSATAAAKAEMLKLKANLDITEKSIKFDVRKKPEQYNIEGKLNNGIVDEATTISAEYRAASDDYLDTVEEYEALSAMEKTLEQRKSMLRDSVALFEKDYYDVNAILSNSNDKENSIKEIIKARKENE